jgi:hypothetical protein
MSRFTYNASALGLGGVVNIDGQRTVISSLASVALAPTGGEAHAVQSNYFNKGIGFDRAESHIYGFDDGNGRYTTYSDVTISGLNLFNRLRIGLMRATVESKHDLSANPAESTFRLTAEYRAVDIDGYEVVPEIDIDLAETYDTYKKTRDHLLGPQTNTVETTPPPPLSTSLVKDLAVRPVSARNAMPQKAKAYGLTVPNFGRAHFAEYLVKPGRRRVTLLRLDLNSLQQLEPVEPPQPGTEPPPPGSSQQQYDGEVSMTSLDGNGSPPWDK